MAKNTIFLWYDKDAEAAARFYTKTFPDSAMGRIVRAPSDYPSGKKGAPPGGPAPPTGAASSRIARGPGQADVRLPLPFERCMNHLVVARCA